ncbi:Platinum sensitivity protein, partial [Kappamyces sp. JEL0680]
MEQDEDAQVEKGSESFEKYRVKIYEMSEAGNWIDKGTGLVQCTFMARNGYALVVRSETDGSCVLNSKITENEYQTQQSTLILWHDISDLDFALSFQHQEGCAEILRQIQEVQKRLAADKHDIDQLPQPAHPIASAAGAGEATMDPDFTLPPPTLSNLERLEKIFTTAVTNNSYRETLLKRLLESEFLEQFIELLEQCEDMEMVEDCYRLSTIVKCICKDPLAEPLVYLNHQGLYVIVLQDPYFMVLLGMLEYDREYPTAKAYYREYFQNQVQFKQVVPIKDEGLLRQIQRVYRASYLKDVALARTLEDSTFATLNGLIGHDQSEILETLLEDQHYLEQVFQIIHSDKDPEKRKESIAFVAELTGLAKNFTKETRSRLYESLAKYGLYSILKDDLLVFQAVLEHNPIPVRTQMVTAKTVLPSIIGRLKEKDDGIRLQIIEILKLLLDTTNAGSVVSAPLAIDTELDKFLEYFYENCADLVFEKINGSALAEDDYNLASMLLDLLGFLITQNGMFCKNHLIHGQLFKNVAVFLSSPRSFLRLASLRVFRLALGLNDEFYRRLLMKQEVLGKVLQCLVDTQAKNNLLNSACLEFFYTIANGEGTKSLIVHLVSHHRQQLALLNYVDIFNQLIAKYDDWEGAKSQEVKDGYGKVDNTQEAYFEGDDANGSNQKVSEELEFVSGGTLLPAAPIQLVPYKADDSDEEDDLVIRKSSSDGKEGLAPKKFGLQKSVSKPRGSIKIQLQK